MPPILMNPKFFPTVMVVCSICAAVMYGAQRDYRHMVYWISSAVLISSVTY